MGEVKIYSAGLGRASVCAPKGMPIEQVLLELATTHPAGTERGWQKSEDPTFRTGETNPCPCNLEPGERQHWLLEA